MIPPYDRKVIFYTFNLFVIIIVGAMVLYTLLTVQDLRDRLTANRELITIDVPYVVAENPNVCPGDMLRWDLRLTYHSAPMLMEVVRNITDLDKGIVINYEQKVTIPVEKSGSNISSTEWLVPELSSGRYRVIVSTTNVRTIDTADGKLLQYYVDFTIKDNCMDT